MNVSKYLANGHGGNIIQGSVSLDDENAEGCMEIVRGFLKNIESWWGKVKASGQFQTVAGAIQGDLYMFGLPVWDGTATSVVKVPATPTHPSQAWYPAREAGLSTHFVRVMLYFKSHSEPRHFHVELVSTTFE